MIHRAVPPWSGSAVATPRPATSSARAKAASAHPPRQAPYGASGRAPGQAPATPGAAPDGPARRGIAALARLGAGPASGRGARFGLFASTALALSGCAVFGPVGPDLVAPEMALPATFAEAPPPEPPSPLATAARAAVEAGTETLKAERPLAGRLAERAVQAVDVVAAAEDRWWRAYDDPLLDRLAMRGLEANLGVAEAAERISEAWDQLRQTGLASQASGGVAAAAIDAGGDLNDNDGGASLSAAYVFDLFGGARRNRQRALAELEAAGFDLGAARLAYLSAIVDAYIELRYYQEAIAITRQSLATRRKTRDLVGRRKKLGDASDLDVARSQALLDAAAADLPGLETGFFNAAYAIATLLAAPAQPLLETLTPGAPQPRPKADAQAGVPADLLRRRPDIRAAERDVIAATAAVGVAEAARLPSLTLSGVVSIGATEGWAFGPSLVLPIFNQPVLRAQRDAALSRARQAEILWRATVLDAVEEVQAAQGAYRRDRRAVAARQAAARSYQTTLDLSTQAYGAGEISLFDLLDTEREQAEARLVLARAVRDEAADWARLQIAAGKGWGVSPVLKNAEAKTDLLHGALDQVRAALDREDGAPLSAAAETARARSEVAAAAN